MGRLDSARKGNIARKRRLQAVAEEFEADRALQVEESLDAAKPDEDLFFVDTSADTTLPPTRSKAEKRRRFFSEKVSSVAMPSEHLVKAVQRIVKSQQKEKKAKPDDDGAGKTSIHRQSKGKVEQQGLYDMWDAGKGSTGGKGKSKKGKKCEGPPVPKSKKRPLKPPLASTLSLIERPLGGQSYNPLAEDHQQALVAAVSVEEKRKKALEKLKAPLSVMSEETKALILSDSESDAEEEGALEERSDGDAGVATKRMLRRKGKQTKAERNKQRRRKIQEHEAALERERKHLLQEASRAQEYAKALRRREAEAGGAKRKRQTDDQNVPKNHRSQHFVPRDLPREKVLLPMDKNPMQAPSFPVPLSDELGGSLRTVRTKGNLASETLVSLQRRGQYEVVPQRKSARPKPRVKFVEKIRGE